jgi:hypothetical protein
MASACRFLTDRLRLKVNESKSAVALSGDRKFLGFSISNDEEPIRQIAPKALKRFKARVREFTRRTLGVSLTQMIAPLARYMLGWRGYFGFLSFITYMYGIARFVSPAKWPVFLRMAAMPRIAPPYFPGRPGHLLTNSSF